MPPAADPLAGPRLALVVATGTYADTGLRRLRAPARDAVDLALVLANPDIGGFAVTTVIDKPAQPIRLAVEDFLDGRTGPRGRSCSPAARPGLSSPPRRCPSRSCPSPCGPGWTAPTQASASEQ
jgi:hypothetical protein